MMPFWFSRAFEELWFVVDTGRVPLSRKASDELHAYLSIGHGNEGRRPHGQISILLMDTSHSCP